MHFSTLVLRNILRRPTRSALTIVGVAVAIGAVVALVGIARSFQHSLLAMYQDRGVDLIVARAGGLQRMSSSLRETLGPKIERLSGVSKVSPGLAEMVSFENPDPTAVLVRGMPADSLMLRDLNVVDGRLLKKKDKDRRSILLGKILARDLDKTVGEMVEVVEGEPYQVVGIYESFNFLENRSIIMPLRQLQWLMDREGEVTAFVVKSQRSDRASLEQLRARIVDLAPHLEAVRTREFIDTATEIRMARAVAWMTSTIALLVGTVGMINTMLTAVYERTRELALLRAIGWRKWRVMMLVLLESVLLGLFGAVVGTALAVGVVRLLSTIPTAGRMVAGEIDPSVILQGFAIAFFVGLAGGLYPAWRAAQLVPTEGLRHE